MFMAASFLLVVVGEEPAQSPFVPLAPQGSAFSERTSVGGFRRNPESGFSSDTYFDLLWLSDFSVATLLSVGYDQTFFQ